MRAMAMFAAGAIGLGGCAIHPQTEDYARLSLPRIVQHLRCEAGEAARSAFAEHPEVAKDVVITFDFTFTLTENDDATSDGSFEIPISHGKFTLGWNSGLKKTRSSKQDVKFEDLVHELQALHLCEHATSAAPLYPITGAIGLKKTFDNYVSLRLQRPGHRLSEYVDDLTFTTELSAGIKPKIELAPTSERKTTAGGSFSAKRTDVHEVALTFVVDAKKQIAAYAGGGDAKARARALVDSNRSDRTLKLIQKQLNIR